MQPIFEIPHCQLDVQDNYKYFSHRLFPNQWKLKHPNNFLPGLLSVSGGAMASSLVRSPPDRAVRVRALAGDIVLCSWARHFTLTAPLSTQVYKWVPANLMLGVP